MGVDDGMTIPGNIGILDLTNHLVSTIEVAKLLGDKGYVYRFRSFRFRFAYFIST